MSLDPQLVGDLLVAAHVFVVTDGCWVPAVVTHTDGDTTEVRLVGSMQDVPYLFDTKTREFRKMGWGPVRWTFRRA